MRLAKIVRGQQHGEKVNETENSGTARIGEIKGQLDDAEGQQTGVDDSVFRKNDEPGIGPHNIGRPERDDGADEKDLLPACRHAIGQHIGQRVGDKHADNGGEDRHLHRIDECLEKIVLRNKLLVVGERPRGLETATQTLPEAYRHHDQKRHGEKDQGIDQGRVDRPADE